MDSGSLAIVQCLDGRDGHRFEIRPSTSPTWCSANTTTNGDEVENRLAVPKFRGGRAPTDIIKLNLVEEVRVDTSRDIA